MGSEAVRAVNTSADMDLVAALGRGDDLQELVDAGAEVVIDLTVPESSEANVRFAVEHGMHAVVGTTGWAPERLDSLRELLVEHPEVGVLIAPNFAIGSILATEFAAKAARYFESVEIIEIHHPNKVDAPSGTAVHTARKVATARAEAGVGGSRTPPPPILWARAVPWSTIFTYMRYVCVVWWRIRRFCWAIPVSSW